MTLLVAVTGGSGSGKSTFAAALVGALKPGCAQVVSEDWYYRDVGAAPGFDPAAFDFDDLAVRDHDRLLEDLQALRLGQSVRTPQYCFVRHARLAEGPPIAPSAVIVVEGSQLLCRADIQAMFDLKLYLEAPDDIRFIRRLLRDQSVRGRTAHSVIRQYLTTVRPAHERWTAPTRAAADLVIVDDALSVEPEPALLARLVEKAVALPALAPFQRGDRVQG